MEEFSLDKMFDHLPLIVVVLIGPILAHITYAIFSKGNPTVGLYIIAVITLLWMIVAAPQRYGNGLATYSNSAVSVYVLVATGFLWFAHHHLVQKSALRPKWSFHVPIALLFGFFCLLLYKFHIQPHVNAWV